MTIQINNGTIPHLQWVVIDKCIGSYVDIYNRNKTTVRNDKQRWKQSSRKVDKYDLQSTFSVSLFLYSPIRSNKRNTQQTIMGSVFHCSCTHRSALTSVTHSRRWAHKKVESSCCRPKLSNDRQDRVRTIFVRTKSGKQYVKSMNMWTIQFNIQVS
jgi:hypothetical protein